MNFGQFARQLREQHNISQDTMAKKLGFEHRSNISKLEAGKLEWKLSHLTKLAQVFNMTTSELLEKFESQ